MMDFRKLVACGFVAALAVLPLGGSRDMAMASGGHVIYRTFASCNCSGASQTVTTLWSTVEHELNTGAANSYKRSDNPDCLQ